MVDGRRRAQSVGGVAVSYARRATWLLAAVAAVLVLAFPYRHTWGGGLVTHAAMAALVGGLTDWYAVKALFGRPLGIRWQTEWIARRHDRIVAWGRQMVADELLTVGHLYRMLRRDGVATALAARAQREWPAVREAVIGYTAEQLLRYGPEIRAVLAAGVRDGVRTGAADLAAALCRRGAVLLATDGRAETERWLRAVLRASEMQEAVTDAVRAWVDAERAENSWKYQLWRLRGRTARADAAALLARAERYMTTPERSARWTRRLRLDLLRLARRCSRDDEWRAQIETAATTFCETHREEWMASVAAWWTPARCEAAARMLVGMAENAFRHRWTQPAWRRQAERQLLAVAARVLPRVRGWIGDAVERELSLLSGRQMAALAQAAVADDVAMIRITGTVIGGVLGAAFFLLALWLRGGVFHA